MYSASMLLMIGHKGFRVWMLSWRMLVSEMNTGGQTIRHYVYKRTNIGSSSVLAGRNVCTYVCICIVRSVLGLNNFYLIVAFSIVQLRVCNKSQRYF